MNPVSLIAMRSEFEKLALLERLVRLGATDIPGTPRLLMRHRNPQELKSLQHAFESGWHKRVTDPIMGVAEKGIGLLPSGKVQEGARAGARLIAKDPIGHGLAALTPVPVLPHAGVEVAKKGLEKLIDRFAPLAS